MQSKAPVTAATLRHFWSNVVYGFAGAGPGAAAAGFAEFMSNANFSETYAKNNVRRALSVVYEPTFWSKTCAYKLLSLNAEVRSMTSKFTLAWLSCAL